MIQTIPEILFGVGSQKAIGKLVINHGNMKVPVGNVSYAKIMIAGVVYGCLTDRPETELWECGFDFKPRERYAEKPFSGKLGESLVGYRIDQILTTGDWDNPDEHWGERLDPKHITGIGKILVYNFGPSELEGLNKYLIGGVVVGNSLEEIGNQELWTGEMNLTPVNIFSDTGDPGVIRGLRLDQVLTSDTWHDGKNYGTRRWDSSANKFLIDHYVD